MRTSTIFSIGCLLFALLSSCTNAAQEIPPTLTSVPISEIDTPEPTSCEDVEGICLELTFNVESCTFEGPTDLKPGPVAIIFHNESQDWVAPAMFKVVNDKTLEDLLHFFSEEPVLGHHPSWFYTVPGISKDVNGGESHFGEGNLEPGIYALVCAHYPQPYPEPPNAWLAGTWTIED